MKDSTKHGFLRILVYVSVLGGLLAVTSTRTARGEPPPATLSLGRDLMALADLLGEAKKVVINGEHAWAASAVSSKTVHALLDRFEASCHDGGAAPGSWGSGTQAGTSIEHLLDRSGRLGVLRSESADEGVIVCFAPKTDAPFHERLKSFTNSFDLGEIGKLRYAYLRKEGENAHVLTLWTDDHFRLVRVMGLDGSEPESDDSQLPRPIESRRLLVASIEGSPYTVLGYVSHAAPSDVLRSFADDMAGRGWTTAAPLEDGVRGFHKAGTLITVGAEREGEDTVIGIAVLGDEAAGL